MANKRSININGSEIVILRKRDDDYISLTDMARYKNPEATGVVISHWLSTRFAIDFLGIFEQLNNPDFNITEFSNKIGFVSSVRRYEALDRCTAAANVI